MAEQKKKRGRPGKPDKLGIYSRIDRGLIAKLDAMAEKMQPTPTRAQLIELAVRLYVERSK